MWKRHALRAAALGLGFTLAPAAASSQGFLGIRWPAGYPSYTVEAFAGLGSYGRLLLQAAPGTIEQRELRGNTGFAFGGAVGANLFPRTAVRLGVSHTSADLEFNDNTGDNSDLLDLHGIGTLGSTVLSLEATRYIFPEKVRLTPYATVGYAVTWWNLSNEGVNGVLVDNGTEFRTGAIAALGLQYHVTRDLAVRLEATGHSLGNPFTGGDSFRPRTGFTIDEPTRVRQSIYKLDVAYTFGRPGAPRERAGRR
ncbi:MAG TPA: outer membrane beta-barrel protein [Longimicrobiales bacterium]|nr:outer membrane beta-barrel protein [Longimicrobiales bacterium]